MTFADRLARAAAFQQARHEQIEEDWQPRIGFLAEPRPCGGPARGPVTDAVSGLNLPRDADSDFFAGEDE